LEKVRSKREIVTLVVLILRFLKDIQVEMSRRLGNSELSLRIWEHGLGKLAIREKAEPSD